MSGRHRSQLLERRIEHKSQLNAKEIRVMPHLQVGSTFLDLSAAQALTPSLLNNTLDTMGRRKVFLRTPRCGSEGHGRPIDIRGASLQPRVLFCFAVPSSLNRSVCVSSPRRQSISQWHTCECLCASVWLRAREEIQRVYLVFLEAPTSVIFRSPFLRETGGCHALPFVIIRILEVGRFLV